LCNQEACIDQEWELVFPKDDHIDPTCTNEKRTNL
jgi:hypothetical protein